MCDDSDFFRQSQYYRRRFHSMYQSGQNRIIRLTWQPWGAVTKGIVILVDNKFVTPSSSQTR